MLHLPHSGSKLFEFVVCAPETLLNQSFIPDIHFQQKLEIFDNFQCCLVVGLFFFLVYQELRNTEPCENE